jgi:hypothetical protein
VRVLGDVRIAERHIDRVGQVDLVDIGERQRVVTRVERREGVGAVALAQDIVGNGVAVGVEKGDVDARDGAAGAHTEVHVTGDRVTRRRRRGERRGDQCGGGDEHPGDECDRSRPA